MRRYCANCNCECVDEYYKVLDNYLQVHYFDDEASNCFCSQSCFCEFVMLEDFNAEDEEDAENQ